MYQGGKGLIRKEDKARLPNFRDIGRGYIGGKEHLFFALEQRGKGNQKIPAILNMEQPFRRSFSPNERAQPGRILKEIPPGLVNSRLPGTAITENRLRRTGRGGKLR
ncbi:hypothetical protein AGMMS49942_17200 [Spirochaetia bacterium]|nr:hypothetical protein AGMMS49942_17200 [Spirochaetia bacterium]